MIDQGVDLYRQDFNMDPLVHWRGADAPDRQGITEIRHAERLEIASPAGYIRWKCL